MAERDMLKKSVLFLGSIALSVLVLSFVLFDWFNFSSQPHPLLQHVFFVDNISSTHSAVIDLFNRRHAGRIEVVPVNLPFTKFSTNERKELLARSLRNRSDRVDVFAVDQIWVPRFSRWCERLDHHFTDAERSNILECALEPCTFDGSLMAVPLYVDIGLMYYRRDVLQQLPDAVEIEQRLQDSMTWDEFLALRQRLNLKRESYYLFQADDYEGLVCNYFELIAGLKKDFFVQVPLDLRAPEASQALQMMVDFVHRYRISPPAVAEFDEIRSYQYMLSRNAMFVRGWPNFLENYRTFYEDTIDVRDFGRAALPHFPGHDPVSVYGGWNLMISKYSPNKDAALEFIRFLQSDEIQRYLFESGGYIPANARVYADTAFLERHPNLKYYRRLLDRGFHRPALVEYTKVSDIISHFVHQAIKGEITVSDALSQASGMIEANQVLIK